jgi:nucleotide-binding universal stress UspA family protein
MKTILAPVDSSPTSNDVVAAAAALAQSVGGRLILLTVVQPPVFTAEYSVLMDNVMEITAIGERAAANHLAKLQTQIERTGLPVETVQQSGSPVMHIIEQAEKYQADYVVMGSHGHTAFYDLLVGSTTRGVLKRAHCPVVIVPPKEPSRDKARP